LALPLPVNIFVGGQIPWPPFDEGDDVFYRRYKFPAVAFYRKPS
jgi:hypothetical protein